MALVDLDRRAVFGVSIALIVAGFLIGYFVVPMFIHHEQPKGITVLEAYITPSEVKSEQPTSLVVRVSNNLEEYANVTVLISIEGDVERYVNISGFRISKQSPGLWNWSFGVMPPHSEVKYVAEMTFNVPSGIAEIKYRVNVYFEANGSIFDSKTFIIKVST